MLARPPRLPTFSGPAAVEGCGFLRDQWPFQGGVMNLLSLREVRQLGLEHLISTEQCVCVSHSVLFDSL